MRQFDKQTEKKIVERIEEFSNKELIQSVHSIQKEFSLSDEEVTYFVRIWSLQ